MSDIDFENTTRKTTSYFLTNPFGTADMIFIRKTILLEETDAFEEDCDNDDIPYVMAEAIVVHNVNSLVLEHICEKTNFDRSEILVELEGRIFDGVNNYYEAAEPVRSLLMSHSFSMFNQTEDGSEDKFFSINFTHFGTTPHQNGKMHEVIRNNGFLIEQMVELYNRVYYGCTHQVVIDMITRIKRQRYVDDLEGFFEKRLYAKELADDISENTKFYQEYFNLYGEEHPDLIGDIRKF